MKWIPGTIPISVVEFHKSGRSHNTLSLLLTGDDKLLDVCTCNLVCRLQQHVHTSGQDDDHFLWLVSRDGTAACAGHCLLTGELPDTRHHWQHGTTASSYLCHDMPTIVTFIFISPLTHCQADTALHHSLIHAHQHERNQQHAPTRETSNKTLVY